MSRDSGHPDRFTLGPYEFRLSGPKLVQIRCLGGPGLLHEGGYEMALDGGRAFRVAGWDECFPTIESFGQSPIMGELIDGPVSVRQDQGSVTQTWRRPRFEARRIFRVGEGGALEVVFEADNLSDRPMEFLWASHALFAVEGLVRVRLPDGKCLEDFSPNGTCAKTFVPAGAPVVIERAEGRWQAQTDQPWWGIWHNRGGWPAGRPAGFAALGIEATNAPADRPRGAILAPRGRFGGKITLSPLSALEGRK